MRLGWNEFVYAVMDKKGNDSLCEEWTCLSTVWLKARLNMKTEKDSTEKQECVCVSMCEKEPVGSVQQILTSL